MSSRLACFMRLLGDQLAWEDDICHLTLGQRRARAFLTIRFSLEGGWTWNCLQRAALYTDLSQTGPLEGSRGVVIHMKRLIKANSLGSSLSSCTSVLSPGINLFPAYSHSSSPVFVTSCRSPLIPCHHWRSWSCAASN